LRFSGSFHRVRKQLIAGVSGRFPLQMDANARVELLGGDRTDRLFMQFDGIYPMK